MRAPWKSPGTSCITQQLILLLSIFGTVITESSITTSCKDASVSEGGSTTLSCSFSVNIDKLKNDFKIELYTNKSNIRSFPATEILIDAPTPLLLCHWSGPGMLNCYEHEGYKYGGYDGNTVRFHVIRASLDDSGKYACVLLSHSMSAGMHTCNLTVQAESNGASNDTYTLDNVKLIIIILGVLTGIIMTLLAIVTIIFFNRRRSRLRKEKEAKSKTEEKKLVDKNADAW